MRRGHIQNMDEIKREKRLWAELRMVATRAGVKFIAGRAPEHDKTHGLHLHVTIHLPNIRAITDAIETIGQLTGAPAVWCDMRGRCLRSSGRTTRGVVAKSACGGWLLQRQDPASNGSSVDLVTYTAKGTGKSKVEGQHRLSNDLAALARQWQSEEIITARAA